MGTHWTPPLPESANVQEATAWVCNLWGLPPLAHLLRKDKDYCQAGWRNCYSNLVSLKELVISSFPLPSLCVCVLGCVTHTQSESCKANQAKSLVVKSGGRREVGRGRPLRISWQRGRGPLGAPFRSSGVGGGKWGCKIPPPSPGLGFAADLQREIFVLSMIYG